MAGDVSYLSIRDENKKELEDFYVGKLRNFSMFSLRKWIYTGDSSMYRYEKRISDNRTSYYVWTDTIINEIRDTIKLNTPLTEKEKIAYEETIYVLD